MRLALIILALGSGCTASGRQTAFIVSGESLKALGHQAADTSAAMNKGLDSGKVTVEQYRAWAEFAKRFQLFYPTAVDTWHAAQAIADDLLVGQLGEAIGRLSAELLKFYAKAKEAGLL